MAGRRRKIRTLSSGELYLGALALALLTVAGVVGMLIGQYLYDLEPSEQESSLFSARLYWALNVAWFAIALALSARGREGGAGGNGAPATTRFAMSRHGRPR